MDYTSTIDVETGLTVDEILEKLEPYNGTIGVSKNGYRAIFSFPADTLAQAIATAQNTVASFATPYALAVTPTELANEQLKSGGIEPLVSVTEAAQMLGLTPQAVTHRLRNKTLSGAKVGNTWVVSLAAVLAESIDSN